MKLKSLIQNSNRLEVAEVELEFIPGIPQIHFLGLPDRIIKESFYRIKSALKSTGYKFPLSNQMIVNIKPNHLRKSSRGVELAVALGILLKTNQISSEVIGDDWVIYGELGLDGSVFEPSDLAQSSYHLNSEKILTGIGGETSCYRLENLKNLEINFTVNRQNFKRPMLGIERLYTEDEAEFLFLSASSGLHGLLAGDSGAGKSTLAYSLSSFLSEPVENEKVRIENFWRPVVAPHHSITPAAFLGGGQSLYEGEVERVSGGVLLLDELLEFDSEILESLRGPMTGEKLRLSRASALREIESNFQVIATTNLCPCGKWTPLKEAMGCRFSRTKCTRYLERFSGPILDRFAILLFCHSQAKRRVSGSDVYDRIMRFRKSQFRQQKSLAEFLEPLYSQLSSRRRLYLDKIAFVYAVERVAQSSSDQKDISLALEDYKRAEKWVIRPFELLEKGMG